MFKKILSKYANYKLPQTAALPLLLNMSFNIANTVKFTLRGARTHKSLYLVLNLNLPDLILQILFLPTHHPSLPIASLTIPAQSLAYGFVLTAICLPTLLPYKPAI